MPRYTTLKTATYKSSTLLYNGISGVLEYIRGIGEGNYLKRGCVGVESGERRGNASTPEDGAGICYLAFVVTPVLSRQ